ncbi:QsdR family transcriptional regulator [Actinoplanes sp. NPDC051343]|uniref:QsdR family transcriptional regulator n=1 Tax=Actinoplanes sp. NPDC051343 TaxID=3363906 RepID=UPI00379C0B45
MNPIRFLEYIERSGMESRRVISRDAVVRGAMRQFAAAGSIDMQSLAGDLAISRATLYRVAGSRDALLGEALWTLGRRLLDVARSERVRRGPDGVIEVSQIFADRLGAAPPMRIFIGAEPETAARVLFTPSGAVHRRIVLAQRDVFIEAGLSVADLAARAFLYVRIMESVLYSDLINGRPVRFKTAEGALRALLTAA